MNSRFRGIQFAALVLAAAMSAGCASMIGAGTSIDWDKARQVKGGMTEQEVSGLMGKPYSVTAKPDGTQVWVWSYASMLTGKTQSAALPFDKDGKAVGGFNIPASFK